MMREDPVLKGEDLFRQKCASCHKLGDMGPTDGKLTAPTLDGWGTESWVLAVLDNPDSPELFGNTPFKGKMPSYTRPAPDAPPGSFKAMPPEQMQSIARYLANEARGLPAGHDPEGEKLVRQRCTTCHLLHGDTDDAEGVAPELAGWGGLAWTRAQLANPGTMATYRPASMAAALEGHMPRFDGDLSAADLDLLTRFVVFRAQARPKGTR
jgi:ubiquinol-cytochrome c reductase cytochrome b subunit